MKITKAVIPAAGRGTRLLPATISQPKEMLPVVDRPVIQMIIEELSESGIKKFLVITGRTKRAIEDHFDPAPELENELNSEGKKHLLEKIQKVRNFEIDFKRQKKPTGLADAIYLAKEWVGNEDFVVALGDGLIYTPDKKNPFTKRLIETHKTRNSAATLGIEDVGVEKISKYGALKTEPLDNNEHKVMNIIEKPDAATAPSSLAAASRYVFNPVIFDYIEKTKPGFGGEKQISDSIKLLINDDRPVYALELSKNEKWYDIGSHEDLIKTNIFYALLHPEFGKKIRNYIKSLLNE